MGQSAFNVTGNEFIGGRHLMQEDVDRYFFALAHMAMVGVVTDAGPDGYIPVLGIPTAGVFARVDRTNGNYGSAQFLGADAVFGRYQDGEVWLHDRKAEEEEDPNNQPATIASPVNASFANQGTGGGRMRAGPDGRRPGMLPWKDEGVDVFEQNITFIGAAEEKLVDPYVIVLRGSSYGAKNTVNDHFAFAGHHWHISDHRGPSTGKASPDDRRSTRWYDIDVNGQPSVDRTINGQFQRGYNAGSDKLWIVHKQVGECAGGDPEDMTLALNLSDRTGQGGGLVEYQSGEAFYPPNHVDRTTSSQTAPLPETLLGFLSYSKWGGPLTAGHPKSDKHFTGMNGDGLRSNSMHIHINAKLTNDSVKYDGRDHINPTDEPFVRDGIIPVRVYHQWNPFLPDPHVCGDEVGGWDYWTKINRVPIWDDPGGNKGDPGGAKQPTDPGRVKTPTEPDGQAKPDPGGGKMIKLPPPPVDYSPVEERVPSIEGQPSPDNGEDPDATPDGPITGPTDWPEGGYSDNTPQYSVADIESIEDPAEQRAEIMHRAKLWSEWTRENTLVNITGHTWSDHMKSPVVNHLGYFYKQVQADPKPGLRGLARNMPDYTNIPVFAYNGDQLPIYQHGTAPGVAMMYPPEFKRHQLRHDYPEHKKPSSISAGTFGLYPGMTLAFGPLASDKGSVVSGTRIFQDDSPSGGASEVLTFRGVDSSGGYDIQRSIEFENAIGLANMSTADRNTILTPYAGMLIYNTDTSEVQFYDGVSWSAVGGGLTFPLLAPDGSALAPSYSWLSSPVAGMWYDPVAIPDRIVMNSPDGSEQMSWDASGVTIPNKLTVGGVIDPTGIVYTAVSATPQAPLATEGTFFADDSVDPAFHVPRWDDGRSGGLGTMPVNEAPTAGTYDYWNGGVSRKESSNVFHLAQTEMSYNETISTGAGAYVGGFLQDVGTINVQTGVFIWSMLAEQRVYDQQASPGFAAFTMFQDIPILRSSGAFPPLQQLHMNIGANTRNQASGGTLTTNQVVGINLAAQLSATGAGSRMNLTNLTGLNISPTWNTGAGTTIAWTNIRGVHCRTPAVAFLGSSAGTELLSGAYVGLDFDNVTFGTGAKIAVRSALNNLGSNRFLENNGTAISTFAGAIRMNDNVRMRFGTSDDVGIFWNSGLSTLDLEPASGQDLRLTFNTAEHVLQSANFGSGSSLLMGFDTFAFGQTSAVGNQVGIFVAPTRSTGVAGGWSDFLLTQAGNITVDHAMSQLAGWTINAPSITLGTGSVTDAMGLLVGGNVNQGTNRYGVLILSNPTGGTVNEALRVQNGRARFNTTLVETTHEVDGETIETPNTVVSTGTINDSTDFDERTFSIWSGAAVATITGIANPTTGRRLEIYNQSANALTLNHLDGGSAAANQFDFTGGANITLNQDDGIVLRYVNGKWRDVCQYGAT